MNIKDLNDNCAFGHRSTNYLSKRGEAPNIRDTHLANKTINSILGSFVQFLDRLSAERTAIPIEAYDEWGQKSSRLNEMSPVSFANIFPMRLNRSAEIMVDDIRASKSNPLLAIMKLHDEVFKEEGTHMKAARRVMALLKDNCDRVFCDDPLFEILSSQTYSQEDGIPVSDEVWRLSVLYQDLQERCDSVDKIRSFNALINSRPEIVPDLLGMQMHLCDAINLFLVENPEFAGSSIAFHEIALWDTDVNKVIPSTRFLKIILHNWGIYFLEKPHSSIDVMLRHAIYRALEDELYHQNIFIFRRVDGVMRLYGTAFKVCPAKLAVGKMMLHFLSE